MKPWHVLAAAMALGTVLLLASMMSSPFAIFGKYAALANLWPSVTSTVYHAEAKHLQRKLGQATVDLQVSRAEVAQLTTSAAITTATTNAQDTHINAQRADTARDIEVIHERIAAAPADCLPIDDPVVRQRAAAAVERARAAQDRLQRTTPDRSAAVGADDLDRLAGLGGSLYPGDWLGPDRLWLGSRYGRLPEQISAAGRDSLTLALAEGPP